MKDLTESSLTSHLETYHDVYRSFVLNRELTEEIKPWVFNTPYSHVTNQFIYPVPGALGG